MYRFYVRDNFADSYGRGHSVVNFLLDVATIEKYSSIDNPEQVIIYINDGVYNRYEKALTNAANVKVIIDFSWESGMSDQLKSDAVSYFNSIGVDTKDILFIFNTSAQNNNTLYNIVYIDFFAIDAVRRLHTNTFSHLTVNERPRKVNLLIGKLKKIPRFLTLYNLYQKNLLDSFVLSILCEHEDIVFHKSKFPWIEKSFYKTIPKYYGPAINNLDPANLGRNDMGTAYTGWPNHPKIYNHSSVSLICETSERWSGWASEFITEKTYRTIANKHPFVMQGSPGILKHLRSQGFRTFNEIIDESYDDCRDENYEIIDRIVNAAVQLCERIPDNVDLIQSIVDHNYAKMIEIGKNERSKLIDTLENFINS